MSMVSDPVYTKDGITVVKVRTKNDETGNYKTLGYMVEGDDFTGELFDRADQAWLSRKLDQ